MDMKKILEEANKVGSSEVAEENDISKEILRIARFAYESAQKEDSKIRGVNPWWRGVDMMTRLQHLGKTNVRGHLEKLSDKSILERKMHGSKKVYRIRVLEGED